MSSRTNSRATRTPAAQTPATTADASPDETPAAQLPAAPEQPAPDETPATTADAPEETTDAPGPEQTPATPDTESDESVTPSDDAPETTPAPVADAAPDAPSPAPAAQMFSEMLATATSATVASLDDKLAAFAAALTIARTETLRILAARKDDEIISTVTVSARPSSASGRGPTLVYVLGKIAQTLGGAGFCSYGNCHLSTNKNPIHGHVVIPEVAVPFWNAIYQAVDAPFGPNRTAEATTRQINKAGIKAGTLQFSTGYQADNKLPRINMVNTVDNLVALVPVVSADDEAAITAMRDLIAATTAEFTRVTSVTYIPKGATYVVTPDDRYAVKQELTTATV